MVSEWHTTIEPTGTLLHMGSGKMWVETMATLEDAEIICDNHKAEISELIADRDKYKPYYDAVIDMATIHWTLDGLSMKDAHHAIQQLVAQYCIERTDPEVNEEMAKITAERDDLQRRYDELWPVLNRTVDERNSYKVQLQDMTARAEKAERRLAAVVEMLKPYPKPRMAGAANDMGGLDRVWKHQRDLYTRAVAIAEGRADE